MSVDNLDGEAHFNHHQSGSHSMHFHSNSLSNPDLLRDNSTTTAPHHDGSDTKAEYPEHVLKVYKSDQVRATKSTKKNILLVWKNFNFQKTKSVTKPVAH